MNKIYHKRRENQEQLKREKKSNKGFKNIKHQRQENNVEDLQSNV